MRNTRQPISSAAIDWSNPITRGLKAAYLPGTGDGKNVINLAGPYSNLTVPGGNGLAQGATGRGLKSTYENFGAKGNAATDLLGQAASGFIFLEGYGAPNGLGNNPRILAINWNAADTSPYIAYGMYWNGTNVYLAGNYSGNFSAAAFATWAPTEAKADALSFNYDAINTLGSSSHLGDWAY